MDKMMDMLFADCEEEEEKRRQLHEIERKMCKLPIIQIIAKID
jgi:hypothetical protein